MDEETRRIIIGVRLEKCKEDLQAARELLRLGFLRAAVNRADYGISLRLRCSPLTSSAASIQACNLPLASTL